MKLISSPTIISAAEASVMKMQQAAESSLSALKEATLTSFHDLWDDRELLAEKLQILGENGESAFDQHKRAVIFLLESNIALDPVDFTPPVEYIIENGFIKLI